jgi:hypothetical protein
MNACAVPPHQTPADVRDRLRGEKRVVAHICDARQA